MERDNRLPENVIQLVNNAVECSDWQIDKFDRAGQRSVFSIERFMYVVFDDVIFIRDLFHGTSKKYTPSSVNEPFKILRYVHLASDRGFILYETTAYTLVSIVDIDLLGNTFKLIGTSFPVIKHRTEADGHHFSVFIDDVSHPSENIVTVKIEDSMIGAKIHVFKIDRYVSSMELHQTISVPDHCAWFTCINKQLVFVQFSTEDKMDRCYLDNFMVLDFEYDCSLTELEDTSTCLQARSPMNECVIYPCGIQGSWHDTRFYVLCNFCPGDRDLLTTVFLSVFEFNKRKWSEIHFNMPLLDHGFAKFDIQYNGVLSLLHHDEIYDEESKELLHTKVTAFRLPLRKPDRLLKLAWFKAKKHGLPKNFVFPHNFPYEAIF